ncbi:secreted RxLR effector protein 161-like [Osmia bicornis bicornis]|uniref:secreted RxLR effector protein 161-like n=1 Tax=Osmia bicornis bicornis TaxID=1437191 RepID=UPI001EAF8B47|nr:secreted RxLR effector protein 161-like [Osmia bicornis bicornis]XP_046145623.1 secreted RxLR effector protein 161-like [Osmia bicornis bicornis]XP_046145651.1 secreted RxLR effector protein 161-like [Osmia bicornis bicornis]
MTECRGAATPLDPGTKVSKRDSPKSEEARKRMSRVPYRNLIGSLMYLALHTRPDLIYAITKLSQFNSDPGEIHWHQAKHVLRYLRKTKGYRLAYVANEKPSIRIYCDADWAGDVDDRHSYSGMAMKIGNNTVQWYSSKQRCIATSTMEAEYISLSRGVKEAIWVSMLLDELQLSEFIIPGGIEIYSDNRAAIDYSKNRVEKAKTKHIDIAYHIVREKVEEGLIKIDYVATEENPADILTKGLKSLSHDR